MTMLRIQGMKDSPVVRECRSPVEIRADLMEDAVWGKVPEAFAAPETLLGILRARNDASQTEGERVKAELISAGERLSKNSLEFQQVPAWARHDLLSVAELGQQLAQVREQKEHWEERGRMLEDKPRSLKSGDAEIAGAEAFCQSVKGTLATLSTEKKESLRVVVERVWVDGSNNLEIDVMVPGTPRAADGAICETALSCQEGGLLPGERMPFKLRPVPGRENPAPPPGSRSRYYAYLRSKGLIASASARADQGIHECWPATPG